MSTKKGIKISITKAHGVFGHIHKDAVQQSAKHMNIKITCGKLALCKDCAKFKAKQKQISKESTSKKATDICKQVYLDLSKMTGKNTGEA